ncbi:DEAD/DEAH box helicase family protein [Enterobacter hormaechei]|uniref:DEAD/DEAH box helicase family protein n=7 Tax=Enterobacter cloacae complex TaxID=354276 RepID=UPI0007951C19|nr:DEAD/DEAH box helicase family protein [Enterobacter hormaechei]MCU3711827.1 DEAD/DEAH box helicase family protein [Enterobacter hormaechei subsp. hoffmannii]HCJ7629207.1 DEAD/DEAH box helicase family protein [Enterobacter hormaechei subsp. xiangfangensis]ELD3449335.1 DEAD/DEAH box helicase family protein [Enterobacter hormaechei]ELD3449630.1 DEAD/DEAH box helicase family protein [Enterobacter hormaechei]MCE1375956.1 DEAD/DEAH box helicase family protein [Enterobacter hormaechei]
MTDVKTLSQVLIEELGKRSIEGTKLPDSITGNLNPAFPMRPYQERAFKFFKNYWEEAFDGKPRQNHQLLFHMATGSGKTLMMAGLISYLYEKGYRNFLFFVNNSNIIEKTRDNFLNSVSKKYLFAETISFGDKRVAIREVENFQSVNPDDINIVFSTIQGLHMALNTPKENSLTYDDFEDQKIVLISDEAHHINADTKKGKEVDQEELFGIVSWEGTVEKIFRANTANLLLEFTATVDFSDDNLKAKYLPKLLFDYPLKEFRKDGYSKEVKVLQADLPLIDRALQAVLLSQYRRKIFEKNRLHIKPVIMFKSKTIKDSQAFFEDFVLCIKTLNAETLQAIKNRSSDETILKVFAYLEKNNISLENLIIELKEDFSEEKLISVNSKEDSVAKQLAVNSLETNEYRSVFAVDKLNEGWDVLNLFDIVRLYDTRDSKGGKIGKTTMSEAQLIGRGARYCPFQTADDEPLYRRKFDSDLDHEMRICEELYYHSAYNPKYIQELNTALQEIGMKAKETKERQIHLKDSFKQTALFKAGHVFLNDRVKYLREDINGLESSIINRTHHVSLRTGYTRSIVAFEAQDNDRGANKESKDYLLKDFGTAVVRKALQRIEFYEFSSLKKYLPNLRSVTEFITSDSYLGRIKIEVTGLPEQVANLSPDEKLDAAIQVLSEISGVIASDKIEFKGSKEFTPRMIKEVFTDKTLNFMIDGGEDQEFGKSMNNVTETAYHLDLTTRAWFVFDDCFGTSEEKLLIQYIDKKYKELSKVYSEAYLIRNEKHFKIYAFEDGRPFEPDFILYLIGKEKTNTMHYQVFVEPKGTHLLKADEWKEKFLVSIKEHFEIEQLFSNKKYVVWGLPFYNSRERMTEFEKEFETLMA